MQDDLRITAQRLAQEYLSVHNEDASWLRGEKGTEWSAAYERLVSYVCQHWPRDPMEWRAWSAQRPLVVQAVREIVS